MTVIALEANFGYDSQLPVQTLCTRYPIYGLGTYIGDITATINEYEVNISMYVYIVMGIVRILNEVHA